MLGWFVSWFQRFVQLGIELAFSLVAGLLRAPVTAARRVAQGVMVRRGTTDEVLDLRHRVLRQGQPRESARFPGDDAPQTRHWVAIRGDQVVGVVSVMQAPPPEPLDGAPAWQLRGMATEPTLRGQGVGERLLLQAQSEVRQPMWCNAREGVVGFYERYGWKAVGPTFEIAGVGPHRRMIWRP
jgi:predicted GNAT family N-acyltransferase